MLSFLWTDDRGFPGRCSALVGGNEGSRNDEMTCAITRENNASACQTYCIGPNRQSARPNPHPARLPTILATLPNA